ncbi:MAG: hypothetical protein O2923_04855 [Verrucomicrobia bacterium]|nr:hypothetical protein [Verrucomicrobiota bacterium]MDA1086765.1 hypothetical protein [Verrucomicrobiota bacterium]
MRRLRTCLIVASFCGVVVTASLHGQSLTLKVVDKKGNTKEVTIATPQTSDENPGDEPKKAPQ